jgi:hypothetical protein
MAIEAAVAAMAKGVARVVEEMVAAARVSTGRGNPSQNFGSVSHEGQTVLLSSEAVHHL